MPTIKYTREDITKLENERDSYKQQVNLLREDIALLKKNQKTRDKIIDNLKETVAESIKYKRERDELIQDLSNYRKVLKVFARLIKNKLAINASGRYIQYQHMLDDIGINADELEGE